jgi:hypothetical protein
MQVTQRARKQNIFKRGYKNEAVDALSAFCPCKLFLNT